MKRLLLTLAAALVLLAQEPAKLETCGGAQGHECHCVRRTHAIQDSTERECGKLARDEHTACMARIPFHCDLIDEYIPEDTPAGTAKDPMSNHCTMACKRHDCRCDDGPVCHVMHQARDHGK